MDPTTELLAVTAPLPAVPDGDGPPPWVVVGRGASGSDEPSGFRPRRVLLQLAAGILAALAAVALLGTLAARQLAEREAVNDAAHLTGLLADAVVQPALTDGLMAGDPAAVPAFDAVIRERVLGQGIVRVKLWSPEGRILYADEPALIGQTFALSEEQLAALRDPTTRAEISELDASENAFEASSDRLVEVYRPVWAPNGSTGLFEVYSSYDPVGARTSQLWRGFAGVTASSLVLLLILVAPIVWHLVGTLQRIERQRAELLQRAVDASDDERRRIAASLHDGPVQELAASSFTVSGAAARAASRGEDNLAHDLEGAASSVRTSLRALRTLLVDIYPPNLATAGIGPALHDLAQGMSREGLVVHVEASSAGELGLSIEQERLVFRVAQECLRNAAKHAGPATVLVALRREGADVVLDVADDGRGFPVAERLQDPEQDHFGLRLLTDLGSSPGTLLQVSSAPNRGTQWRLILGSERVEP